MISRTDSLLHVKLRDLPSVDELARGVDDPLAVDAARALLDRAREEIRAGAEPGDLSARLRDELSSARANSVVRLLMRWGMDPRRLAAAGFGEFRPRAPNDTPEHRAQNRRIEITLERPEE